jgi:hypothetical protein
MNAQDLKTILEKHKLWLDHDPQGVWANLQGANLQGAYLQGADLQGANLQGADLRSANLQEANLQRANLQGADLQEANLQEANLRSANLRSANLQEANLRSADLQEADLQGAYLQGADLQGALLPEYQLCPQNQAFIGFKKVNSAEGKVILTLEIQGPSTSSLVGRKCRAKKVKVLKAETLEGAVIPKLWVKPQEFESTFNVSFKYQVGQTLEEPSYDRDIRVECTQGLHFFMTKKEAIDY